MTEDVEFGLGEPVVDADDDVDPAPAPAPLADAGAVALLVYEAPLAE